MSTDPIVRDLTIDDHTIHLEDTQTRQRPTLVLLHGILMDHTVWQDLTRQLDHDYRIVSVDFRGYGRSTTRSPDITFEDHAADLVGVCRQLDLDDVTLVGWSMGGAIAQVAAAAHPGRWARLVLVDTTPQLVADDDFPAAVDPTAATQLGGLLSEDYEAGCRTFANLIAPEDQAVAARLGDIAVTTDQQVALAAFANSGARRLQDLAPHITTPTHVMCGSEDRICPLEASRVLAATIAGSAGPVTVIENAGHAPFLTRPDRFLASFRGVLA